MILKIKNFLYKGGEMRLIDYRQPLFLSRHFHKWHYWGDVDGGFKGPVAGNLGRNSQAYTGFKDKNNIKIYGGDIIQSKCEMVRLSTNTPTGELVIRNYEVRWDEKKGRWGRYKNGKFELLSGLDQESLTRWYKIIGNISEGIWE